MQPVSVDKTRGACSNPAGRFESRVVVPIDEADPGATGIAPLPSEDTRRPTRLHREQATTIISRNQSPDIPFDQSINPYRGCEHGCVYCFARPSHAWLGLSAGLDFETEIYFKDNAAQLLEQELQRPGYRCKPINIGANTDPYQHAEQRLQITRSLLRVLSRYDHPVTLVTKGQMIERDLDILKPMAKKRLCSVAISVTTLDSDLKRRMEPRATSAARRLATIRRLSAEGIPVTVLVAPVIPAINDHEIEDILAASAEAGARSAGYVLLRLPHELKTLFPEWLETHYPDRARHTMSLMRQMHGGKAYEAGFGLRQRGRGPFAQLISIRFRRACERLNLHRGRYRLDTGQFSAPGAGGEQLSLLG